MTLLPLNPNPNPNQVLTTCLAALAAASFAYGAPLWDLQPYVSHAATLCVVRCNHMWHALQPYVIGAATVCNQARRCVILTLPLP